MPEDTAKLTPPEGPLGLDASPAVLLHTKKPEHEFQLYLDGVTVSFDGFKALNTLSLMVEPGELRTIIGPNGAGKTTMMDVVTGKTRPDHGTVSFNGDIDLTKLDEVDIARLGIGRKFQVPAVFRDLTVRENLQVANSRKTNPFVNMITFRQRTSRSPVTEASP